MGRWLLVWLHRWVGLLMTVFLILVGLTGSLLAFKTDLERLICPQIYATPKPGVPRLDLATLAELIEPRVPHGQLVTVDLMEPDQALLVFEPRTDPVTRKPYELGFVQMFVDPWTGRELGRRRPGDFSQGRMNIMPFVYDLHVSLLLGAAGVRTLGIVALLWTIDSFVGFYLTLPASSGSFWRRWKPAWLIKWKASAFRLNFDLHRAGGLWVWAALFVFAWSSVMLNWRSLYDPLTHAALDYQPWYEHYTPSTPSSNDPPRLGFRDAVATGNRLMAEQARKFGFTVGPVVMMYWMSGDYFYFAKSSRDIRDKESFTMLMFNANTGAFRYLDLPTGQHSGNTVSSWLYALHMADVFGLPYRVFVCVLGLLITMLSVTGVYIWWKKRRARLHHRARLRPDRSHPASIGTTAGSASTSTKGLPFGDQR